MHLVEHGAYGHVGDETTGERVWLTVRANLGVCFQKRETAALGENVTPRF